MVTIGASEYLKNVTSPEQILSTANIPTNGLFGIAVWGVLYVIIFFMLISVMYNRYHGEKEAFLAASVVMIPISILMSVIEVIDITITMMPVILTIIGVMIVSRVNEDG